MKKITLSILVIAVLGSTTQADEVAVQQEKVKLRAENDKAISKLLEDIPTDEELLKDVNLTSKKHKESASHLDLNSEGGKKS